LAVSSHLQKLFQKIKEMTAIGVKYKTYSLDASTEEL
jgi:hypothetical protein